MRIRDIDIDGFGLYQAARVEGLPPGLVILKGDNEAGKSTLLAFLKTVLFGFPRKRAEKKYEPLAGGRHGGRIVLVTEDGREITVERFKGAGGARVMDATETQACEPMPLLANGVTRELFSSIYAFSLDELGRVDALQDEAIRTAIYGASTTGGAVSIPGALKAIEKELDALYGARSSSKPINRLLKDLAGVRDRLREAKEGVFDYDRFSKELAELDAELDGRDAALADLQAATQMAETRKRLTVDWLRLGALERELAEAATATQRFPEDGVTRIDQLMATFRERRDALSRAREEYQAALDEAAALERRATSTPQAASIEALSRRLPAYLAGREQLARYEALSEAAASKLENASAQLGALTVDEAARVPLDAFTTDAIAGFAARIDARRAEALLAAAESARRAESVVAARKLETQALDSARPDSDRYPLEELERLRERRNELAAALVASRRDQQQLAALSASIAAQWRRLGVDPAERRVTSLDEVDSIQGVVVGLRERLKTSDNLRDGISARQQSGQRLVGPIELLASLGLGVITAMAVSQSAASALASAAAGVTAALMLLMVIVALGVLRRRVIARLESELSASTHAMKRELDLAGFSASPDRDTLAALERLVELLESQRRLQQELRQIGELVRAEVQSARAIPKLEGVDSIEALVDNVDLVLRSADIAAEARRHEAAILADSRNRVLQALTDHEDGKAAEAAAIEALEVERQQWEAFARSCGLPSVSPNEAAALLPSIVACARLRAEIADAEQRVENTRQELSAYDREVAHMLAELGMEATGEAAADVETLADVLSQARMAASEARRVRTRAQGIEARTRSLEECVAECGQQIEELLSSVGAEDAASFKQIGLAFEKLRETRREATSLESMLRATVGAADRGELDALFEAAPDASDDVTAARRQCDELRRRRADIHYELQRLASSDDIARLRGEEEALKERIRTSVESWSRLSVARRLLLEAKRRFEEERQPAVVRDAGVFFSTITGGRYKRVIATVGQGSIEVVDERDRHIRAEDLSRGAMEQLYLAIRFGYIRNEGPDREKVPIIMDDILVNADSTRARLSAKAILEVARGHQVLFFTCHPHIVALLREISPDVPVVTVENGRLTREEVLATNPANRFW